MTINKLFVVGAGFMGSGIAQTALQGGLQVTMYDVTEDIVNASKAKMMKAFDRLVSKGKITEEDKAGYLQNLTVTEEIDAVADADFVVEAILENAELKKETFKKISAHCRADTILASNTSSIPITDLASAVPDPTRFVGTHFFSPVPAMKLLEIVKGLATSDETIEAAKEFGKRMGKVCIISKDAPGFIVNRMLDPMLNEAISLLESGIGTVEDIDIGVRNGLNHPMGPLELIDMAGADILLAVMEVLYHETGDSKYRPTLLLRNMVRAGWCGKKAGIGFYVYPENGERYPNPNLEF